MNTEVSVPFKEISFPTPQQMTFRQARRHKGFLLGGVVLLYQYYGVAGTNFRTA